MRSSIEAEPGLRRVLGRRDLIIYGLVILTPTAPFPVYGIVQQASEGHAALSYLIAMVAMLFTAASYGRMSAAFPSAGSTYTFAQRALNEHVGFLAGWAMILDYFLIPLLSVIYASLTASRLLPQVPYAVWAVSFTAAITAINVRGIRVTARANNAMIVVMTACAALFIALAARWVAATSGAAALVAPSSLLPGGETFAAGPVMLGAGIATLSYIGFDAISTLAEDAVRPERDIAAATVLVCVLQAAICVSIVYLAGLVWPDYRTFPEIDTAILDISGRIGGSGMLGFVTVVLLVAGLASALTGQAGASRLLYGMGRDGVISRPVFAYIDPRYSTPTRAIYLMGAVSLAGALAMGFQLAAELLNFGAFTGFILVNLSVIRHYYFRLGRRAGADVFRHLVWPALGAATCTYVWISLSGKARLAGFLWLGIGAVYLAAITRGFRRPPRTLGSLAEGSAQ